MAATGSEAVTLKQLKAYDQSKGGFSAPTFTLLFNSDSGELSSATLSQSIANFKMIAVMCRDRNGRVCSTLCYNNGSSSATVVVSMSVYSSSKRNIEFPCCVVGLDGTSATLSMKGLGEINYLGDCSVESGAGALYIKSIVGIDW